MTQKNILVSSVGRRVGLMQCIRDSVKSLGRQSSKVLAIDSGSSAPASFLADGFQRVPRCTDPAFIDTVLHFCESNDVGLIIPTIDTELPAYAGARGRFADHGITISISAPETVRICCDKIATHDWFVAQGFPTVRQADIRSALKDAEAWSPPLIAKPFNGSASTGLRFIHTRIELESAAQANEGYIVQEIASGREYTINIFVNRSGECVCAIPHLRMEVRGGEVSKGVTIKDPALVEIATAVGNALPGAYGALNIQGFKDDAGSIKLIEVNARFGGGYPLAHQAGARFTDWLLDELEGKSVPAFTEWTNDLAMLRYDEAVYIPGSRLRA